MSREGKIGQSAAGPGQAGGPGAWGTGRRWELRAGVWLWLRAGLGCATQARWPGLAWPGLVLSGRPQLPAQTGLRRPPSVELLLPRPQNRAGPPTVVPPRRSVPGEGLGLCGSRHSIASGPRKGLSEPRVRRGKRLFVAALP